MIKKRGPQKKTKAKYKAVLKMYREALLNGEVRTPTSFFRSLKIDGNMVYVLDKLMITTGRASKVKWNADDVTNDMVNDVMKHLVLRRDQMTEQRLSKKRLEKLEEVQGKESGMEIPKMRVPKMRVENPMKDVKLIKEPVLSDSSSNIGVLNNRIVPKPLSKVVRIFGVKVCTITME